MTGPGSIGAGVVLVHGIVSRRYLEPTVRELAGDTRVLVPTLPGFRRHDRRDPVPSFADQADAIADAMSAWGGTGATVVGHSLGAEVVVELARRHPSMVGRAVLVGPTGDPTAPSVLRVWGRWMATAVGEPLSFNAMTVAELATWGPRRMAHLLRRSFTDPVAPKLGDLRCPTLLIRGAGDLVAPQAWLDRMAGAIPDSTAITLPHARHTLVFTDARPLAELVRRFSTGAAIA
jgi:pimeloyl-ACP methyl ester carboxylesterase